MCALSCTHILPLRTRTEFGPKIIVFSIPSVLRAICALSVNLARIFQTVIFARKLQFNENRNTSVSMKFPFTVQDSCSKSRGKEKHELGASQKPQVVQVEGIWVSSVCSLWGRVKIYTWNPPQLRKVQWWLALLEACFPLDLFKKVLFHFNKNKFCHFPLIFFSFFKPKFYFPPKGNINFPFPALCHLFCVAKINVWEMEEGPYTGTITASVWAIFL